MRKTIVNNSLHHKNKHHKMNTRQTHSYFNKKKSELIGFMFEFCSISKDKSGMGYGTLIPYPCLFLFLSLNLKFKYVISFLVLFKQIKLLKRHNFKHKKYNNAVLSLYQDEVGWGYLNPVKYKVEVLFFLPF
jgi:hypothetical protein